MGVWRKFRGIFSFKLHHHVSLETVDTQKLVSNSAVFQNCEQMTDWLIVGSVQTGELCPEKVSPETGDCQQELTQLTAKSGDAESVDFHIPHRLANAFHTGQRTAVLQNDRCYNKRNLKHFQWGHSEDVKILNSNISLYIGRSHGWRSVFHHPATHWRRCQESWQDLLTCVLWLPRKSPNFRVASMPTGRGAVQKLHQPGGG